MEWIARRSELDDFEPEQRLAAVWCEDERHAEVDRDHPTAVMVLDEDDQAEAVANFFGSTRSSSASTSAWRSRTWRGT